MAGYSKEQLVDWLKEAPQTLGWGAILAFNRTDTNTVLRQEYIQRFSTNSYLPPVEGLITDVTVDLQYITDYVLDYPRLSFEIADIENESPDAHLSMQVVGGTQVTFKRVSGGLEPSRIDVVDPLNGPELTLDLNLVDVPGDVTSAGKVVLDLSRSSNFKLSYSDFVKERELGGLFFQSLFEDLPDDKRTMVISEIKVGPDEMIRPSSLKIRTQAAPGAKVRSADNYGDGAVVVLVGMEGEPAGGNPDSSFRYLIPNDAGKDYSATILLGNRFMLSTVGKILIKNRVVSTPTWNLKQKQDHFWVMHPNGGALYPTNLEFGFGPRDHYYGIYDALLPWPDQTESECVRIVITDGHIDANYIRAQDKCITHVKCRTERDQPFSTMCLGTVVIAGVMRPYELDVEKQALVPGEIKRVSSVFGSFPASDFNHDDFAREGWNASKVDYERYALYLLSKYFYRWVDSLPAIDTLVLHSLIFQNNNIVLDDMAFPGDLALFGRVGPSLTRFTLEPVQPMVGTGDTQQFSTLPAGQSGLSWKVENILGQTGDPGTISASGLYKAPTSIKGAFIRVKVTATNGNYSSSALVSVVVNDITVGPQIQVGMAGHSCLLSAGTRGTGQLTWSLRTPANGGKLEADPSGKHKYTAPLAVPDKSYIIEEIVVTNALTHASSSARVLVILGSALLSVRRDASGALPAGQTKLCAFGDKEEIIDPKLAWEVVAGSGSITANGLFTQPATLEHRFAVVRASMSIPGFGSLGGYHLLPLPLFDYPELKTAGLRFMAV